jgi:sec-independent protein translocase protein TatA
MGDLSVWHWLIVAVVLVVLFGSTRLPDAARSIGRSLRILESEMRESGDDRAESSPQRAFPDRDSEPGTGSGTGEAGSQPAAERPGLTGSGQAPGSPAE